MRLPSNEDLPPNTEIAPLPDDASRPSWSVMLPTYNCDEHFESALRSVLDQDPGPDRMQIAVVDDGSTVRRHEEVIRRLAPSRIEVYHRAQNVGLAGNWNECIARSVGRWVHILHQDDLVLAGFYERLALADAHPEVGAAFCRHAFIDAEGRQEGLSTLQRPTAGILDGWLATISQNQQIQCPSIVVRRGVYERLGGFRRDLCYALDWEMWVRIAMDYRVWFEPEPLACYRIHGRNETSRLQREGRTVPDIRKAIRIMHGRLSPGDRDGAGHGLLSYLRDRELRTAYDSFQRGELGPGLAGLHRALRYRPTIGVVPVAFAYYKWALKIWLVRLLRRASSG